MKLKKVLLLGIMFFAISFTWAQKTVLVDLSHGQCKDVYPGCEYYTNIMPKYQALINEIGAKMVINEKNELNKDCLKKAKVLLMLSPLNKGLQRNITDTEKKSIIDFIKKGGSVILFVDEEERRVAIESYGANEITRPFGIEFGEDVKGLPGNCGAVSFENEIFGGRREIPFSGARLMKGGIPASVCMEQGYQHSSYVKLENGGKLFAASDTMVGQLMGYDDGVRNVSNKMETRWWGKDSYIFMKELITWALH
jgi:hypothetical protein